VVDQRPVRQLPRLEEAAPPEDLLADGAGVEFLRDLVRRGEARALLGPAVEGDVRVPQDQRPGGAVLPLGRRAAPDLAPAALGRVSVSRMFMGMAATYQSARIASTTARTGGARASCPAPCGQAISATATIAQRHARELQPVGRSPNQRRPRRDEHELRHRGDRDGERQPDSRMSRTIITLPSEKSRSAPQSVGR
jgi:hypothetical protein